MTEQHRPRVDVRSLVARLSQEGATLRGRELVAPLLPAGKIRTRVNGLIYSFKPQSTFTGWGRFRPTSERAAELVGEALPWERAAYLELFPLLRVVLLWPLAKPHPPGTWLALPFNASDARQRFGLGVEPIPIFLCDPLNGAERFERVLTRIDGTIAWFEGTDLLADPQHGEWLRDAAHAEQDEKPLKGLASSQRLALLFWRIHQLEQTMAPQQQREMFLRAAEQVQRDERKTYAAMREEAQRGNLERLLRHELAKADAVLLSFSELPQSGQLVVEWSEQGQTYRYRSTIDRRMNIVSSGICLSDRDHDFDLTSLVNVMTRADDPWNEQA